MGNAAHRIAAIDSIHLRVCFGALLALASVLITARGHGGFMAALGIGILSLPQIALLVLCNGVGYVALTALGSTLDCQSLPFAALSECALWLPILLLPRHRAEAYLWSKWCAWNVLLGLGGVAAVLAGGGWGSAVVFGATILYAAGILGLKDVENAIKNAAATHKINPRIWPGWQQACIAYFWSGATWCVAEIAMGPARWERIPRLWTDHYVDGLFLGGLASLGATALFYVAVLNLGERIPPKWLMAVSIPTVAFAVVGGQAIAVAVALGTFAICVAGLLAPAGSNT